MMTAPSLTEVTELNWVTAEDAWRPLLGSAEKQGKMWLEDPARCSQPPFIEVDIGELT